VCVRQLVQHLNSNLATRHCCHTAFCFAQSTAVNDIIIPFFYFLKLQLLEEDAWEELRIAKQVMIDSQWGLDSVDDAASAK
jgi:hypothetical protein